MKGPRPSQIAFFRCSLVRDITNCFFSATNFWHVGSVAHFYYCPTEKKARVFASRFRKIKGSLGAGFRNYVAIFDLSLLRLPLSNSADWLICQPFLASRNWSSLANILLYQQRFSVACKHVERCSCPSRKTHSSGSPHDQWLQRRTGTVNRLLVPFSYQTPYNKTFSRLRILLLDLRSFLLSKTSADGMYIV